MKITIKLCLIVYFIIVLHLWQEYAKEHDAKFDTHYNPCVLGYEIIILQNGNKKISCRDVDEEVISYLF